ncbi:hypothetical protein BGZ76_003494, partial [Entomortierella beljakovae]
MDGEPVHSSIVGEEEDEGEGEDAPEDEDAKGTKLDVFELDSERVDWKFSEVFHSSPVLSSNEIIQDETILRVQQLLHQVDQ